MTNDALVLRIQKSSQNQEIITKQPVDILSNRQSSTEKDEQQSNSKQISAYNLANI